MSRDQIIRDTAYAIWEAEGKPHGRSEQHWKQAEAHVAGSLSTSDAKVKKSDAKVKTSDAKSNGAAPTTKAKVTTKPSPAEAAKPTAKSTVKMTVPKKP